MFLVVSVPLKPAGLQRLAQRVSGHLGDIPGWNWDVQIGYVSVAETLTPETDELVLRCVALHPVVGGLPQVRRSLVPAQTVDLAQTRTQTEDLPPAPLPADGRTARSH
jgi:hypothetical protein